MEQERNTEPNTENIWKWGIDNSICMVDIKRLTDKLATSELISIITEELQLTKINIIESAVDVIEQGFERFSINENIDTANQI